MSVSFLVYQLFNVVFLILFIAVLLSWFPGIDWSKEPFNSIRKFSELCFEPFRRIIPPVGMIDISPIVCFLFLSVVEQLVLWILKNFGL